jgi:hypothetical protein
MKIRKMLAMALTILGCFQLAGYVFKSRALRGIGFSFGASPYPIVFGTVGGVEGFNTQHSLRYQNINADLVELSLDQSRFREFQGSYLLKNVYAIFLAYPHMLKPEQVKQGANYLLCKENIFNDFGIKDYEKNARIESVRVVYGNEMKSVLQSDCDGE